MQREVNTHSAPPNRQISEQIENDAAVKTTSASRSSTTVEGGVECDRRGAMGQTNGKPHVDRAAQTLPNEDARATKGSASGALEKQLAGGQERDVISNAAIGDATATDNGGPPPPQLVDFHQADARNAVDDDRCVEQYFASERDDAEARLLARRAARAEAREIRMRDLERQQREQEENADRQFDMLSEPTLRRPVATASSRFLSSRRSSEDSLEDTGSLRDLRHELKEVEEKFRKAMIANAQLDNDKAAQTYQLELLKDRLEELEEEHSQVKREHKDKCRDFEQLKRVTAQLKDELALFKAELDERDRLIAEKGLVIVAADDVDGEAGLTNGPTSSTASPAPVKIRRALVSAENAHLLENAGEGSLDVRLARFATERSDLLDQISHLKLELEEEKSSKRRKNSSALNGPDSDSDAADIQREASKQLAEFKFRAQKAEQDVATMQATVARLESQVIRYKTAAETSEKSEEALKAEKRKLQREDDSLSSCSYTYSYTDNDTDNDVEGEGSSG